MSVREACLYLVSRYPGVTHTFIVGEVRALRAAGVHVETASVRRIFADELLSETDRTEYDATYAILPTSLPGLLRSHGHAFLRARGAYARTFARALRLSHAGGRPRLWQAFYFGESILLWERMHRGDIRHIHVHHANVSADIAMLTCAYANASGAERRWTWSLTIHGPTELLDVASHKLPAKVADASAVICTSDYARSQVSAFAAAEELPKVHTVHCGIDVATFPGAAREPTTDIPVADGIEILCVAAISRRKGHLVLLEAFAEVRDEHAGARLTLVGDGSERSLVERRVRDLGLVDAVTLTGAVGHDRVTELYERAHIFCLPSFGEGIPTVLMEAMAMELPVVTTNVMGISELVEHESSGLVVAPARPDLLARSLLRLVTDSELRREMGTAGRERVIRDFEIGGAIASLRECLGPLLRD